MNVVQSILNREKGFRFIDDYDIALLRLKCYQKDVYKGITPNTNLLDLNPEPPVFACKFCSTSGYEGVIALANEDGKIALQNTMVNEELDIPLNGIQAHSDAIFDISWMPQEMKLITASGDHTARLWDVSSVGIKELQIFHAHTRSIKSAVFRHQDKAVFATGARDGTIMIWDIRANYSDQPKPDNCIYNAHSIKECSESVKQKNRSSFIQRHSRTQSITGLVFQDDYTLLSCSTRDGCIKIWDLRKNYTTHKKDPLAKHIMNYGGTSNRNGFTSLLVCPSKITLYASCMDNIIYAYNISSYNSKPIAEYYGHRNSTFYVKACLSPDGKYLASGSSDELAYIWNTKRPGVPLLKLSGHREEVTCIAWCSVGESKIVTCSDDSCHRIWRIGPDYIENDEQISIHGYAEAITYLPNSEKKISILNANKRIANYQTIVKYSSKSDINSVNTPNVKSMEDSFNTFQPEKRCIQISDSYCSDEKCKFILSPIQDNLKPSTKHFNIENLNSENLFNPCIKTEKSVIQLNNMNTLDKSGFNSSQKLNMVIYSPTSNLPNFVVDGTAPHLLEMSPQKTKENIDWLTKIRKEKYFQNNGKYNEKLSNIKQDSILIHKKSTSRSIETRKVLKSSMCHLLQFFKPATKDCKNNLCIESINLSSSCSSKEICKNI